MKTTDEIIRRPWLYPDYPYRAFDQDGNDVYFEAGFIDASIAADKWYFSRQSFEDYQNLTNQQWPKNQDKSE